MVSGVLTLTLGGSFIIPPTFSDLSNVDFSLLCLKHKIKINIIGTLFKIKTLFKKLTCVYDFVNHSSIFHYYDFC